MEIAAPSVLPPAAATAASEPDPGAIVESLRVAIGAAYARAEDIALAREADSAMHQARTAAAVAAAVALGARVSELEEEAGDSVGTLTRAVSAETEACDLRAALAAEKEGRRIAEEEGEALRARSLEGDRAVERLERRVVEAEKGMGGAAEMVRVLEEEGKDLREEVKDVGGVREEKVRRVEFLEEERVRMGAEVAEERSLREMAEAAREREGEVLNAELTKVRENLAEVSRVSHVHAEQCRMYERQLADYQADRERARLAKEREVANMTSQLEIQQEALDDADKRIHGFKEVINGMGEAMKAEKERRSDVGGVGPHADAILKRVQEELDARLDELEAQRGEFEAAQATERKLAVAMEKLAREKETVVVAAGEAESRARVAEDSLQEVLKRCEMLERRLMLGGGLGGGLVQGQGQGMVYSPPKILMASPEDHGQGPVTSMDVVGGDEEWIGFGTQPPQLAHNPSRMSLDETLQAAEFHRHKHDEILAEIAAQRNEFRIRLGEN